MNADEYLDVRGEGAGVLIAEIFYVGPGLVPLMINFSLFVKKLTLQFQGGLGTRAPLNTPLEQVE